MDLAGSRQLWRKPLGAARVDAPPSGWLIPIFFPHGAHSRTPAMMILALFVLYTTGGVWAEGGFVGSGGFDLILRCTIYTFSYLCCFPTVVHTLAFSFSLFSHFITLGIGAKAAECTRPNGSRVNVPVDVLYQIESKSVDIVWSSDPSACRKPRGSAASRATVPLAAGGTSLPQQLSLRLPGSHDRCPPPARRCRG